MTAALSPSCSCCSLCSLCLCGGTLRIYVPAPDIPPLLGLWRRNLLTRKQYVVEAKAYWSDSWVRYSLPGGPFRVPRASPRISGRPPFSTITAASSARTAPDSKPTMTLISEATISEWWTSRPVKPSGPGIVEETERTPFGGKIGAGRQTFTAYSLFHLLDRAPITWAQAESNGTTTTIQHVPPINYREHQAVDLTAKRQLGNRSDSTNADGVYEFSADGALWSNQDAAAMVLANYAAANGPTFALAGQYTSLAQFHDVVELEGRTPWQVLNDLVERHRGFGMREIVSGSTVLVHVFSLLDEAVSLQGVSLPANADPVSFDLDTRIDLQDPAIWESVSARFDKVEVRGDRLLSAFTVAYADGTLEEAGLPPSKPPTAPGERPDRIQQLERQRPGRRK